MYEDKYDPWLISGLGVAAFGGIVGGAVAALIICLVVGILVKSVQVKEITTYITMKTGVILSCEL